MWLPWLAVVGLAADPITWDSITTDALEAWVDGPGAAAILEAEAARGAARLVPWGPTALKGQGQLGLQGQEQLIVALEIPLGLGTRQRRWWLAQGEALDASADAARWGWVQAVHESWLAWWTASEIADHLDDYAVSVHDDLQRFEAAVAQGLLAPVALEDLRAESLQVRAEAAAVEQQAVVAAARVAAVFAGERTLDAGDHELHQIDSEPVNPWLGLQQRAAELPEVRAAAAEAEAHRRRAAALGASRRASVEVGPMWAPDVQGALRPLASASLVVPLQPGARSAQREARGAAAASEADRAWRERALAARLVQEGLAFDAALRRLQRLQDEVLQPLVIRQQRLEAALEQGLVTADRVVRARRERHEAEHEQVLVAGELLASTARADAIRRLLGEGR